MWQTTLSGLWCAVLSMAVALPLSVAAAEKQESWEPEWERLLGAARKEGKVVIYASGGADRYKLYKERFEAAFPGIEVSYVPVGSGEMTLKILAERRAGKYIPDLSLSGAGGTTVAPLRAQGGLQSLRSALLLPEVLDKSKWFNRKLWFMDEEEKYVLTYALTPGTIISYNTKQVNPREIVSYKDLLDRRWRGKIVSSDLRRPGGPGGGIVKFVYANPDLGPAFLRKLYGDMEVTLSADHRQMVDWLGQGRFAFLVFSGLDHVEKAREQGLPVDVLNLQQMKEGYPLTSGWNSILLMNPAPHPNAAKVFINWLLSVEGQTAFEQIMRIASLRTDTHGKSSIRDYLIPNRERYTVISLEKYWHLDSEMRPFFVEILK